MASVLKAYFRELSVPLFPTDKYQAFIDCTRKWLEERGCGLPCVLMFEIHLCHDCDTHAHQEKMTFAVVLMPSGIQ